MSYDATVGTKYALADAEAAVGKTATLPFTGRIIGAGASTSGAWVRFELDPRWGFPEGTRFVLDLDALDVDA